MVTDTEDKKTDKEDAGAGKGTEKFPLFRFILLAVMLNVVLFLILLLLVWFIHEKGISFLSVLMLMVCPMGWLALAVVIFKKMIDKVSRTVYREDDKLTQKPVQNSSDS